MELINYTMPPFTRMQWASKKIKEKYEPLFTEAQKYFPFLERESVKHGLRHATTSHVSHDEMDTFQQQLNRDGLVFLPIQKVGHYNGSSSYHPEVVEGKPWSYYGVIADSIEHAEQFAHASDVGDHTTLGRLLGYPECCINMLNNVWMKGYYDPVWQQAQNTDSKYLKLEQEKLMHFKDIPWELNNLYRSFGVGPFFHVRCSLDCEHTLKMSREWIKLGEKLNAPGLKELELFLRMPVEWDALKGISYLRNPLFKASTNSVMCIEQHRVRLDGTYYPLDAPRSLDYPWTETIATLAKNENKLTYGGDKL